MGILVIRFFLCVVVVVVVVVVVIVAIGVVVVVSLNSVISYILFIPPTKPRGLPSSLPRVYLYSPLLHAHDAIAAPRQQRTKSSKTAESDLFKIKQDSGE